MKGTPQGLLLQPQTSSWVEFLEALDQAMQDASDFFQGGRIILDLGARGIREKELLGLRAVLDRYEVELSAILTNNEDARHIIRSYGIRSRLPSERKARPTLQPETALFVKKTIRSGQQISFPGDVTILGDVNAGAEVIAAGNIVVWGKARGLLHAGAKGDESALICALDLQPAQLRIAGYISRAPDEKRATPQPEVAEIYENIIIVKPWTARG